MEKKKKKKIFNPKQLLNYAPGNLLKLAQYQNRYIADYR